MIAAIWTPDFPLQAWTRANPDRRDEPVAILSGVKLGGGAAIIAASATAGALGVRSGMTVAQARALFPELTVLLRDDALEDSAREALTDVALSFSPRVQIGRGGELGWAFADVAGLERLVGEPEEVARALLRATARVGLDARARVARTKTLARLATLGGDGAGVVPADSGAERAFVAELPLAVLEPPAAVGVQLVRFGLQTIGDLLALPKNEVAERLGPQGVTLCRRAHGEEEGGGLKPDKPPTRFVERVSLDWAVESLEPLAFVLRGALDRLVQRLALRGFLAGDLLLTLEYEGLGRHVCSVGAAAPSRDVRALLSLCRLALAKSPPEQPITQVVVQATPVTSRPRQLSFFEPTGPAPDKLAVTVARLEALCGTERVGAAVPADSYRDDAFQMAPFDGAATSAPERPEVPPVALKRFRPPRPVELIWRGGIPIRLEGTELGGRVVSWRGPFRRSEGWWINGREPDVVHGDYDVYDLLLSSGVAYRVAFDRCCSRWLAQGWYD